MQTEPSKRCLSVAIAGLGAVGTAVAKRLDQGVEGLQLVAVSARDRDAASDRLRQLVAQPVPVLPAQALAESADVVVECAPAALFRTVAEPVLKASRTLVPISVGALLPNWELVDLARLNGARIIVPSGALLGLDAVRAAAEGEIHEVKMVTRKPPGGLAGAPHLLQHGIDVEGLTRPLKVFEGSAREGAAGFPANVNVAAALALAGIGPDRTRLELWADPGVSRNTHQVFVEADSARLQFKIENIPSTDNPRTGRIVAQSVVSALRTLVSPLTVGI